MTNPDNAGLLEPIEALEEVYQSNPQYTNSLSRADFWALAALVGADEAQRDRDQIDWSLQWFGRQDCDSANFTHGTPERTLPGPDLVSQDLLHFFFEEFGFDARQVRYIFNIIIEYCQYVSS